MENNKMSAEDILGKNTGMTFDEETYLIQTHFEYVIKSMEEYASQQTQSLQKQIEDVKHGFNSSVFLNKEYLKDISELKSQLSQKDEMMERMKEGFNLAMSYIDECPCDPDIYPSQLEAWKKLQNYLTQYQNSKK